MAKYVAGKIVRIGTSHFSPGEALPASVEQLSNFDACLKDGTFVEAGSSSSAAEIPAPAVTPAPARGKSK